MKDNYDVIVIGGGPAGSTTGALLAEYGHDVLILEKETFPRYHVGESLMPFCYFSFERLGVVNWLKDSAFPKKYSVQFARQSGEISKPFYFFQHLDHEASTTWQVNRDQLDMMLLDNARSKGAEVKEGTKVNRLLKNNGQVCGVNATNGVSRDIFGKLVIDASGRDVFSQTRKGWRIKDPKLNKVALWTYYKGAKRDTGYDEGATTVAYLPENGWFWFIPLQGDLVSVGIVAEKEYLFREGKDEAAIFQREIHNNQWIQEHLEGAVCQEEYWATGDYSYRSKYCADDGLLLVGDAFAFLDPVFSSGVFLALSSGVNAADAVHEALIDNDVSASRFNDYGEKMCQGIERMRKLVYAFYDPEFSFSKVLKKHPELRSDLTDCLIGDLFDRDFDQLFKTIGEFAKLPEALSHGRARETKMLSG
ncbi:MAG: NAD(P)/FAD-dependent oxidoreductase [Verrucomicrobiota bacterium]